MTILLEYISIFLIHAHVEPFLLPFSESFFFWRMIAFISSEFEVSISIRSANCKTVSSRVLQGN